MEMGDFMIFNKCERCGCFFASKDNVCPNCITKDEVDKASLKSYLSSNNIPKDADTLSFYSGVSVKNINRFIQTKEFSSLKKAFSLKSNTNNNDNNLKVQL